MVTFTDEQVTIRTECSVIKLPVRIRRVTIDGKQMTLSAFEQLPVIHSQDLQKDEICGWVNHHSPAVCNGFDQCDDLTIDHIHGLAITKGGLVRFLVLKSQHELFRFVDNQKQVFYA
jgi:hypothetical protein